MIPSLIQDFEQKQLAQYHQDQPAYPEFRSGDTIRVNYKIEEKQDKKSGKIKFADKKFRIQAFQGVVLKRKRSTLGGVGATFTVRKIAAGGVGVERTFLLWSPYIDSIELIARGVVRRSRLYYLRDRVGKAARIKQKK